MAVPDTRLLLYLERRCYALKADGKTDFQIIQQLEACCMPWGSWGNKLVKAVLERVHQNLPIVPTPQVVQVVEVNQAAEF